MPGLRALNLAQYWLTERADADQARYIRSLMTGPLSTTVTRRSDVSPDGRRRPPTPAWWGNDEDASSSNFAAMASIRRG